jgi:radical SAM-linked protein
VRYRIRWGKSGKLRFLSHHDIATVLERSLRRAALPISYSKGFSAHPKIAFGSGLPVGYGSDVELLDLELDVDVPPQELCARLRRSLPSGLDVHGATRLTAKGPSLGESIVAADYEVLCDEPWVRGALRRFLALDGYDFARPYKGQMRVDDLRVGVLGASSFEGGFTIRCALKPRATRPGDVISALATLASSEGAPRAAVRRVDLLGRGPEGLFSLVREPNEDAEGAA